MKILVTGSEGFIGQHYCRHAANDSTVYKIDKQLGLDISKESFDFGNYNDSDVILHLAATNGTHLFYSNPTEITINDTLATLNLVKHFRNTGKKLVFSSSCEIINGAVDTGLVDVPTDEKTPIVFKDIKNPRWSYSLPKALGENLIINSGNPWLIIRYFNIYGPGQHHHFLDEFILRVAKGEYFIKGDDYRSFCYIDDAVKITHDLVKHHQNQIVNVGKNEMLKISDVARKVMDIMGVDPSKLEIQSGAIGSVSKRCPDTSVMLGMTGFKGYTALDVGLKNTIESLI